MGSGDTDRDTLTTKVIKERRAKQEGKERKKYKTGASGHEQETIFRSKIDFITDETKNL